MPAVDDQLLPVVRLGDLPHENQAQRWLVEQLCGDSSVNRVRRHSSFEQLGAGDGAVLGFCQGVEDTVGVVGGPFHIAMMSIRASGVFVRPGKVARLVDRRGD